MERLCYNSLVNKCQHIVQQLIRARFSWMKNVPYQWNAMFDLLQKYKPKLLYYVVKWSPSEEFWVKCNTDGACKGNPVESSYGFCLTDWRGDLIYAEAHSLEVTTNRDAETIAIWKAMIYCKQHGFNKVRLETDSLSFKNMIEKVWKIP